MNPVIQVLDIVTAILVVLTLSLVERNYKWWIVYAINSLLFSNVTIRNGLPGLTIMGIVLCAIGIRNYFIGRRRRDENNTKKQ